MDDLSLLLLLQCAYSGLGAGYNLLSLKRLRQGLTPLSASEPTVGLKMMSIVFLVAIIGWAGYYRLYIVLASLIAVLIIRGGIFAHVINFSQHDWIASYCSKGSLIAAIVINVFGSLVIVGALIIVIKMVV